jgi:hypothetical protein
MLDGVDMVRAILFKEPPKMVHGQPRLVLAAAHNLCGELYTGASCSFVDATIVNDRGLLVSLSAPILATLGTVLGILGGDIRRRSPAAARDRVKLGHLGADGMMGGDAEPFFGGVLEGIGRCLEWS